MAITVSVPQLDDCDDELDLVEELMDRVDELADLVVEERRRVVANSKWLTRAEAADHLSTSKDGVPNRDPTEAEPSGVIPRTRSDEQLAYSINDAAIVTSVSTTTIKQEIARGRLRARKAGRRTLVVREELERWLRTLPLVKQGER